MVIEQTLILLKPDAVQRNLIGKITTRFEETGLKIVAMKMIQPDENLAKSHYPIEEEWAKNIFNKTKEAYEKDKKPFKYKNHIEIGKDVQKWLTTFICESPVIALVLEGPHAVELVRKITGTTEPRQSPPGTIRGDFASVESYALANPKERTVRNLIHASSDAETAKKEISLWFKDDEIYSYSKDIDKHF